MPKKHHQASRRHPNQIPEALLSTCGSSSSSLSSSPYLQGWAQPPYGRKSFWLLVFMISRSNFPSLAKTKQNKKKDLEINSDLERAIHHFLAEDPGLRFRGVANLSYTAHLVANCPSEILMLVINESKKTTSSTKNRGEIKSTKNKSVTKGPCGRVQPSQTPRQSYCEQRKPSSHSYNPPHIQHPHPPRPIWILAFSGSIKHT